jgi:hypothetical protein
VLIALCQLHLAECNCDRCHNSSAIGGGSIVKLFHFAMKLAVVDAAQRYRKIIRYLAPKARLWANRMWWVSDGYQPHTVQAWVATKRTCSLLRFC